MKRPLSVVAPEWWDYTTLDRELLDEAARLEVHDFERLARPGFEIRMYDTLESFYLAEALEYIEAWRQATPERPVGLCGPIGPTEQLPLVGQLVNALELDLRHAHFWAMDEWVLNGQSVSPDHPLSFQRADRALCFDRIREPLRMPEENLHFLTTGTLDEYRASFDRVRCAIIQGGQGDVKHWAFNDPPRRRPGEDQPPTPEDYLAQSTRVVDLHPMTVLQNARTSGGGRVAEVPTQALTVGPVETFKAERVSIWHAGNHDNAFGMRLTALMISRRIVDAAVPMSLLARHANVRFSYYKPGIGSCAVEMH